MQRIDVPTRSATLPAAQPTGTGASSPGFFSRGDPHAGSPPTTLSADWANMIQEEIVSVIARAAIPLDKGNNGQLLQALLALFVPAGSAGDVTNDGDQTTVPLPGNWQLKFGVVPIPAGTNVSTSRIVFARPFANGAVFIGGNADGGANPNWQPLVLMFPDLSAAGCTLVADSTDPNQKVTGGRNARWLALGR